MLLSYSIVDFHLFFDGAVDLQIRAPSTRSLCKVCDTRVTVKACGPLVLYTCYNLAFYLLSRHNAWQNVKSMAVIQAILSFAHFAC